MLDENAKVWLIEVNTNPALAVECPFMSVFIPTLLENTFRIVLDPIFPPPTFPKSKKHLIPENMWENNKF